MTEEYFTYEETKAKITELKDLGFIILGIERFIIDQNNTIPDMAGIADFSDADLYESYQASLNFLKRYGKDKKERFTVVY